MQRSGELTGSKTGSRSTDMGGRKMSGLRFALSGFPWPYRDRTSPLPTFFGAIRSGAIRFGCSMTLRIFLVALPPAMAAADVERARRAGAEEAKRSGVVADEEVARALRRGAKRVSWQVHGGRRGAIAASVVWAEI